ncbi:hypothetical protein P3X46_015060 [Hevea brasiliensis]|uniref:Fibronectin type III-like domain-containing protein n=1 Tax=Hevea brasiliensis TaxID=3981 RepID=A0ABQ9LYQ8_HEVBR|nr:hypothetical protein P3X46_015060 [Hevea brasiliensis]
MPFCQLKLPIQDRVGDLIGRLTLSEKFGLLVNNTAAVSRLGINRYEWWSEALHGVSNVGPGTKFGEGFPEATSFPQVITTAASFNATLWEAIGRVMSDEARAMYNGGMARVTYWSPNVNIFRDPRWRRGQETPGEDPLVVGTYASRYVRGLQENKGDRSKVAACCKHFTAYDLDNWNGVDRFHFNAKLHFHCGSSTCLFFLNEIFEKKRWLEKQVSKQDMEDTFDVPFKMCVKEGKVASVMCSYNQVNGIPTCADPNLLRKTLRTQWQHYTSTPEEAAADAIKAGLDLDCGPFLEMHTEVAVKRGLLSEADINVALLNTLTIQMRLGMFDGEPSAQPYGSLGPKDVCTPAHQVLAIQAARQGIVLLNNHGPPLALSTRRHRTIAIIGPNSNVSVTMIGNYAGVACGCGHATPLQGIESYAKTIYQQGCADVACFSDQLFGGAISAASQADATVLVMGLDQSRQRRQQELVSKVAIGSSGPTILVLTSGGKLPMAWYPQDYITNLPMTEMAMRSSRSKGYPGRTYRFYKGKVVYPFGHGLSYAVFVHTIASAPGMVSVPLDGHRRNYRNTTILGKAISVTHRRCNRLSLGIEVDVKNVGSKDGTDTLLVYSKPPAVHVCMLPQGHNKE